MYREFVVLNWIVPGNIWIVEYLKLAENELITVDVLKDIKGQNLEMMIIVRISILLCDGYMFTFFGIMLNYFLKKRGKFNNL